MNEEDHSKTEILIIRRGHSDDHGHHGGAWKIAYADFVTAMMAFFLVMWLINSANEATRARVASYFNPIKMTDAAPTGRGLSESNTPKSTDKKATKESTESKAVKSTEATGKTESASSAGQAAGGNSEESLMRDPYKMIDSASQEGQLTPTGKAFEIVSQRAGDPFDPQAWNALREGKHDSESQSTDNKSVPPLAIQGAQKDAQARTESGSKDNANVTSANASDNSRTEVGAAEAVSGKSGSVGAGTTEASRTSNANLEQVRADVLRSVEASGAIADIGIEVRMTSEGLLIVLSDKAGRGMFEVGSAAPSPALIRVVEGVGGVLEKQPGRVVVRGHTDDRRYKSLKFDNWQLSTARAHLASYMLIRGGFDESRLWKIEGYGSSDLQNKQDPLADENRRVEILLSR